MAAHLVRGAVIAFLAFLPFLSSAAEVSVAADMTAALPPPSDPLGGRAITDNTLGERVVLYEEEPGNPRGKRTVGSVTWSTEMVPAGIGIQDELVVRADIKIPDREMEVTWRLRRDSDQSRSTSHVVEIKFRLPSDYPSGGILNVPAIWMKRLEKAQGTPPVGLAVKVTTGYFLIGLSAAPDDRDRNVQLLKNSRWVDIAIIYNNGKRAILTMEKGTPGEQAFQKAFAAWNE
jgi:hypothetical protein